MLIKGATDQNGTNTPEGSFIGGRMLSILLIVPGKYGIIFWKNLRLVLQIDILVIPVKLPSSECNEPSLKNSEH